MTQRLAGKSAIVTGAARGLGSSVARELASQGARVLICDILDDLGEECAAEFRMNQLDVQYAHLDVTREDDWQSALALAEEAFGSLTILVNNAGIGPPSEGLHSTLADWGRIVAVNQTGPFLGMKFAAPVMRKAGGGSIVNVSSIFGLIGSPNYMAYSATKAALRMMTRSAALELVDDNVRVNAVCPGYIRTQMNDSELDLPASIAATPMKRLAEPSEIASAVVFLASDESSYITGIDLVVDGGYLAQ